jgi:arginase
VDICLIESTASLPTEIGTGFELNRLLADRVKAAANQHRFPLVLAGNCNSCIGTLAGIDTDRLGIVWFDAHGDFNTPDTTITGFLDGMGLAMATGRCWSALMKTIPGFVPIPDSQIVHVGSRDLDIAERRMFEQAGVPLVAPTSSGDTADIGEALKAALGDLKARVDRIYLHIDMDVLATDHGQPNHLAVPGGLPVAVVEAAIGMLKADFSLGGCCISSFDPTYDREDCVLNAGLRLIKAAVSD